MTDDKTTFTERALQARRDWIAEQDKATQVLLARQASDTEDLIHRLLGDEVECEKNPLYGIAIIDGYTFQISDDGYLGMQCKCSECDETIWVTVGDWIEIGNHIENDLRVPPHSHPCKGPEEEYTPPPNTPDDKFTYALREIVREEVHDFMRDHFGAR